MNALQDSNYYGGKMLVIVTPKPNRKRVKKVCHKGNTGLPVTMPIAKRGPNLVCIALGVMFVDADVLTIEGKLRSPFDVDIDGKAAICLKLKIHGKQVSPFHCQDNCWSPEVRYPWNMAWKSC